MDNKIIGRFEPIGDDKGPKRSAFNVLTKEDAECLGTNCKRGYTGVNASGLSYSIIGEHWQWVPALPESATGVDKMVEVICSAVKHASGQDARDYSEALYAAGYRKFEIVDEPQDSEPDGGAAFGEYKHVGEIGLKKGGLTIRDYFAGQYLIGKGPIDASDESRTHYIWDNLVRDAYALADAMLAERAK